MKLDVETPLPPVADDDPPRAAPPPGDPPPLTVIEPRPGWQLVDVNELWRFR